MSCSSAIVSPILFTFEGIRAGRRPAATDDSIHSLSGLSQARSSPHLNKVRQEVREAVRAEGYTDGLGQGGGSGGEGHD